MPLLRNVRVTLEMIKWEHSVFALPFALTGAVLAWGGWPPAAKLGWIVVCMVAARSAAMAFNRLADADLDAANPRTAMRALPAGLLGRGFVGLFTLVCAAVFFLGAWRLNRTALLLAGPVLAVLLFYSYTKRFTRFSHLFLGLALGLAPLGASVAVSGTVRLPVLLLGLAVLLWAAGFDVLYACQDFEHDRRVGLYSIPSRMGLRNAFWLARGLHVAAWVLMVLVLRTSGAGAVGYAGAALVGALLVWEHTLVAPERLDRLNAAFFTMNGVIACAFFAFVTADMLLRNHGHG